MMLDLDRFKHVNDTLGHHAGDSLIRDFSIRLAKLLGGDITRLGGDEFAILHVSVAGTNSAERLCERILAVALEPYDVLGNQVFVGTSIGLVLAPDGEPTASSFCAGRTSRSTAPRRRGLLPDLTPEMDETINVRRIVEEELRIALDADDGLEVATSRRSQRAVRSVSRR